MKDPAQICILSISPCLESRHEVKGSGGLCPVLAAHSTIVAARTSLEATLLNVIVHNRDLI